MTTYAEINRKIEELTKQAEALRVQESKQVVESIREQINLYGLTVEDLFGKPRKGVTVAMRYRDGKGNEWSGRGKRPRWLAEALKNGASQDSFLIA